MDQAGQDPEGSGEKARSEWISQGEIQIDQASDAGARSRWIRQGEIWMDQAGRDPYESSGKRFLLAP